MTITEYNKCVDNYSDFVYRFLLKMIHNGNIAKDLVQDAFEKLWRNHSNLDAKKAKAYLFKCAYNATIDYTRKAKPQYNLEQSINIPQLSFNQYTDIQEILQQALLLMKPEQRSVIALRDLQGYQYQEIADITGLSLTQVKVYIFRGRVFLKQYLEKCGIRSSIDLEELA